MRALVGRDDEEPWARLRAGSGSPADEEGRAPFNLTELVRELVDARRDEADRYEVTLLAALAPATAMGRVRLAGRLVVTLVENAIRHNTAGGWAGVTVRHGEGRAVLTVVNTGPPVPDDRLIFRPFDRGGPGGGTGLAVVRAVADAHGATVSIVARPEGGLVIEVAFPAPDAT
ncbi:hypothetical protein Acy02nite_62700 [Actinoplanes cyaneus]|uniref:histidine kinase n=1 Tax=Actinoplanes cyaneus TaxID=52696 RepID=A0A919MAB0_9ACTN|nr:HAMP domain-containing sensor histidine kinase [Actinoplanes cyaneus]MCW2141532.1 Histidine kinase-, DNA gyrase B-, and HSP90-like ATPase [Actinoplanes cyaneus]GID68389.1 hypothetical protein Acy02nite_62700 [Actinoplanes cyaneus]